MKPSALVRIIPVCLVLASCGVRICYESPSRIRQAAKLENQVPITVQELKSILQSDTSQYKVVVLYNLCCGYCKARFKDTYSPLWKAYDPAVVHWYFVQVDCGGAKWNEEFLNSHGIETTMYYIRDDNDAFAVNNPEAYGNITNYLFGRKIVTETLGTPINYIMNRTGEVKLAFHVFPDGYGFLTTIDLDELRTPLPQTVFSTIDTIYHTP